LQFERIVSEERVGRFVQNAKFRLIILGVIFASAVLLGVETNRSVVCSNCIVSVLYLSLCL